MEPKLSDVVASALQDKLIAHRNKEQQHIDALLASQKHLTSNLRTLMNGLDQILQLSTPKFSSSQSEQLHSIMSRARILQKQLDSVSARVQRIQAHLQAAGHQPMQQQPPLLQQQQTLP